MEQLKQQILKLVICGLIRMNIMFYMFMLENIGTLLRGFIWARVIAFNIPRIQVNYAMTRIIK